MEEIISSAKVGSPLGLGAVNDVCNMFGDLLPLPHYPHLGLITVLNSRSLPLCRPVPWLPISVGTSFMNGPWSKMSRELYPR